MKDQLYRLFPVYLQELLISIFNYQAYKIRYGQKYQKYRKVFLENRTLSLQALQKTQADRFNRFLKSSIENTTYYKDYAQVELAQIHQLPILSKESLRQKSSDFFTVSKKEGVVSKTGGTTGKSLEILFTPENMQERFAMLDDFRSRFGYELGKKTAWFSGKSLLTDRDLEQNRFWKTDHWHKVRYYSTFHISDKYLKYYVVDLIKYQPEYLVGFPSTILEIAKYGAQNGYQFPENTIKAIFPTAESINEDMRSIIESFFKTKMYNQYASSEGAPFIFECSEGRLHLELQSGVFEVLDERDQPTTSGRLVVTSFTTEGTPLIRYDIGDSITLEDEEKYCICGNNNPLVKEILGRIDDFVYSPENGKINLGNVSNTLKDTHGIKKFQVIQEELNKIKILLIIDPAVYSEKLNVLFYTIGAIG
ncbi:phenylacetate--CoA ligase family protein [Kaistella daneshvariae]|uniref:phenylacetate--CoA ligase family protein n=1 Tax=Kaistella daneshvariae TaxID=2487074 RepID=UPI001E5D7D2E|nr:phenylacetate--CoA ligase family protein [Kaistella daneshvariae]